MTLFQTVPYVRRRREFTIADRYGAWVVHQDFVRAALDQRAVDAVHFYLPFNRGASTRDVVDGLSELMTDFPGRSILTCRLSDLGALARVSRYVLADDFEFFDALAAARMSDGDCLFPVTTIVHRIPRRAALMSYIGVLLTGKSFDGIIATSEACRLALTAIFSDVQAFLEARLHSDVQRRVPIVKIPLAVDEQFLVPRNRDSARAALGLSGDCIVILYVGRLAERSKADLEPLLHTVARLRKDMTTGICLVIAGQDVRGSYTKVIQETARRYGIRDDVRLITNFTYDTKPLLYAAADVFVSPADNLQETFGVSLLEAMAAGLPVIASDWSGYRDLVVPGVTGFLVKTLLNADATSLADRISALSSDTEYFLAQQTVLDLGELYTYTASLVQNRALRHEMGLRGREKVLASFSWRVVTETYRELWSDQWSRLERCGRHERWRIPSDTRRQFGHFATTFLDPQMAFRRSSHRADRDLEALLSRQ